MNLPRGRPRDRHADAKILKAAMCLLGQHGFRAVTLEGIAAEAGVARTTGYRRWPNKEAGEQDGLLTRVAAPRAPTAHRRGVERLRLPMQPLEQGIRPSP